MQSTARTERPRDAIAEALRLRALGIHVIDAPPRSKNPGAGGRDEWQRIRYTEDDIRRVWAHPRNLGAVLGDSSNGVAEIDSDTAEACVASAVLAPPTDMRHARASTPGAHKWYWARGARSLRLKDPDGTTLVELRANGKDGNILQTIVPPSIHESGEQLFWEADGEPATVDARLLERCVYMIGAAALLARRWPAKGSRHDAALATAGLLLRGGMTEEETARLLEAVAVATGDPEHTDRIRAAHDTAAALKRGEAVTGGPRLTELLPKGDAVVPKLREWLGLRSTVESAIDDAMPLDLFGDATLAGSPDLPRDALPSTIDGYAVDEAERLGVDVAMMALPCLVVCAAAIDDAFVVQLKVHDTEWVESARLWLGVVTEPGGRKTPALQKATAPLRAAEQRWLQPDRDALAAWKNEHDEAKGRPRQRRLIVDDATTEALSDILVDNPRGVLCARDELSTWFGSFDAYRDRGGKDRGLWLELYNGGGKPVDRVKRGNLYVPNWSACLLGGIQPGPMRRLARKIDDDGLVQRFIVVFPQVVDQGVDRTPDYTALARYRETVMRLVDLEPGHQRVVFRLSDAAQAERALVERLARNVMLLPETSAAFRAHLSKWPGLFARLVCTYHVTDAVAAKMTPAAIVSSATAAQVARLMTEYLLPHAARFYSELLGQEHLAHARWIAGHILTHQLERITARDVGRVYRELRGDGNRIADVMAALVLAGWASEIDPSGRQATRWRINPKVHQLFAKRAVDERQRREAVRAEISRAASELGMGGGGDA